jgi:DNA-binding MarR family transcriptional regulator
VDRLEERAFVARGAHPTDRRVKVVTLTTHGEQTRRELLDRLYQPPPGFERLSTADLDALARIVERLVGLSTDSAA